MDKRVFRSYTFTKHLFPDLVKAEDTCGMFERLANLVWPNWPSAMWTGIVKRPMPCSVLLVFSRQFSGLVLSKDKLLSCLIPRHTCKPHAIKANPCHSVEWNLGKPQAKTCHSDWWFSEIKIGNWSLNYYQTLSLTQTDTLSQNKRLQIRVTNLRK